MHVREEPMPEDFLHHQLAAKMRPVLLVLLLGLVGPLLCCRRVWAQSGGGGKSATSLCAELIEPNNYTCIEYRAVTDDGFILGLQNIPCP
ncbi:unnamed protein product [Calypogeia fissa]